MSTALEARRRAVSHRPLEVRVHEHIAGIDPERWDSLLHPSDLLASHRFVRICEESRVEEASYRHLTMERHGKLVAVASLSAMHASLDLLSSGRTREVIRWARSLKPSLLRWPIVMCGLPVSFGGSCVRIRPGEDPDPILEALASEAESFAKEVGAALVCFKEFTDDEAAVFAGLGSRGYIRAASLPYCTLAVSWPSFDDYFAGLRSGYRRQLRADLAAARTAGLELRVVEDFAAACGPMFELYEQIIERAEHRLERLNQEFFRLLNASLGPASRAMLVEHDGRLVASAILVEAPPVTTFLLAGIDYERSRTCHAYPFLVTQILAEAIRRGARTLDLGQTSYALKGRLGAVTQPRWLYLKHRGELPNALLRAVSGALFPATAPEVRRVFRR